MLPDKSSALRLSLADSLLMPDLRRWLNPLLIENPCNLHRGHSIRIHPEQPSHDRRLILRNHKTMPVIRSLCISEWRSGAYRLPLLLHRPHRCLYLYGEILAVQVIKQVLEVHIDIRSISFILIAVMLIVDGNEPLSHKGKNLFQIGSQFVIIPGKA